MRSAAHLSYRESTTQLLGDLRASHSFLSAQQPAHKPWQQQGPPSMRPRWRSCCLPVTAHLRRPCRTRSRMLSSIWAGCACEPRPTTPRTVQCARALSAPCEIPTWPWALPVHFLLRFPPAETRMASMCPCFLQLSHRHLAVCSRLYRALWPQLVAVHILAATTSHTLAVLPREQYRTHVRSNKISRSKYREGVAKWLEFIVSCRRRLLIGEPRSGESELEGGPFRLSLLRITCVADHEAHICFIAGEPIEGQILCHAYAFEVSHRVQACSTSSGTRIVLPQLATAALVPI